MVLAWNSWTISIEHIPWTFSDFTLVQEFNNEHKRLKKNNWDRMISQLFEKQTTIVLKAAHCKIWSKLNLTLISHQNYKRNQPTPNLQYEKCCLLHSLNGDSLAPLKRCHFNCLDLIFWDPEVSWDFLPVDPLKLKLLKCVQNTYEDLLVLASVFSFRDTYVLSTSIYTYVWFPKYLCTSLHRMLKIKKKYLCNCQTNICIPR